MALLFIQKTFALFRRNIVSIPFAVTSASLRPDFSEDFFEAGKKS